MDQPCLQQPGGYQAVGGEIQYSAVECRIAYYPPAPQSVEYLSGVLQTQPMEGQGNVMIVQPNTIVVYAQDEMDQISDYMIPNILACLCCCWCIGIAAIKKSYECQNAKRARDIEVAKRFSESAKKLMIATIVAGAVACAIFAIFYIVFL